MLPAPAREELCRTRCKPNNFFLRPGSMDTATKQRACLDSKYFTKFHYAKRRFPITSKCRHMHEVLNVDEIKN
jgi:hypothetical protein